DGFEERLGGLTKIGPNALPQTFNAKLTTPLILHLHNAVSEKEKQIAGRKPRFGCLELCIGDEAHRRSAGTFARCHSLDFARGSAHTQRRRMTGPGKTGAAFSDVDDTVKNSCEDQRAGLLHNSRELIVQLCEKSTRIDGLSRVRFDQCPQHRGDQRCAHSVSHHITNTNTGCLLRKTCDVKEITAHHTGWQVTMIKTQRRHSLRLRWKTRIGV